MGNGHSAWRCLWGIAAKELRNQPGFADHFLVGGKAPLAGERFVNRNAVQTLQSIAVTRGKSFFRGHLAEQIAADAAKHNSALTLEEGQPNQVGGGKRPFHTIIPGFLKGAAEPLMAFGVMGGMMQAQGHLQMSLRTQLWRQDVQTAADAPRWRVTDGLGVSCEQSMNSITVQALANMGHGIESVQADLAFGFEGAQLIHRLDAGGYAVGSDPRKDGGAYCF